ncbi:MAG: hypothetical protein HQK93_10820 [Nitrospirae bacterium]|nr:hypothetical protein [Nitrospirota bacterium]
MNNVNRKLFDMGIDVATFSDDDCKENQWQIKEREELFTKVRVFFNAEVEPLLKSIENEFHALLGVNNDNTNKADDLK